MSSICKAFGQAWYEEQRAVILLVPSIPARLERNINSRALGGGLSRLGGMGGDRSHSSSDEVAGRARKRPDPQSLDTPAGACHASIASSVNHTVRLPRRTSAAS